MTASRMMVLDLDGTLLGDPAATRRFQHQVAPLQPGLILVYVTSRTWTEVRPVLASPAVPDPQFVATLTGSSLHVAPDWAVDAVWQAHLTTGWQADRVQAIAATIPELQPLYQTAHHPLRCSYRIVVGDVHQMAGRLSEALERAGAPGRVILCSGRCLDVVPLQGGKGQVVRHLMQRLGIPAADVVVGGNDGDDLDMLNGGVPAIAVGNMASVWRRHLRPEVYQARAANADGLLEGLRHWGWLPSGPIPGGQGRYRSDPGAGRPAVIPSMGRLARQFDWPVPG